MVMPRDAKATFAENSQLGKEAGTLAMSTLLIWVMELGYKWKLGCLYYMHV